MVEHPRVAIIIVNWNGWEDTLECVESLRKITYPDFRVIVVDNASSGHDVSILKEKCGDFIHLIANPQNFGFPEGCNIGIRHSLAWGADYFLLLNNDTIVDREFLTELVRAAEHTPSAGIVGSMVYYYSAQDVLQPTAGKIRWWLGTIELLPGNDIIGHGSRLPDLDFVYATSCLIRREVVENISLMDPYFFYDIEEFDYCTRAKRAGFEIICAPLSKVWHKHGASRAKIPQFPETQGFLKKRRGFENRKYYYRLFRTHCPPFLFLFPFLLRLSMLGPVLLFLWRRDWQGMKAAARKRLESLAHLFGQWSP